MAIEEHFYEGPVPSPELLARYGEFDPAVPGRLITMAEKEQAERHRTVQRAQHDTFIVTILGQVFGLFIALGGLATAAYFAYRGNPIEGAAIVGVELASIVGVFVTGKYRGRTRTEQPAMTKTRAEPPASASEPARSTSR